MKECQKINHYMIIKMIYCLWNHLNWKLGGGQTKWSQKDIKLECSCLNHSKKSFKNIHKFKMNLYYDVCKKKKYMCQHNYLLLFYQYLSLVNIKYPILQAIVDQTFIYTYVIFLSLCNKMYKLDEK